MIRPRSYENRIFGMTVRSWHLKPWKKTGLLDDLADDSGDGSDTSYMDILNNVVTQAGNVFGAKNGMIVARPKPGQMVPAGSGGTILGMSTQTALMLGAAALGAVLILKKK